MKWQTKPHVQRDHVTGVLTANLCGLGRRDGQYCG